MAIQKYTLKEFAAMCGMETKKLSAYKNPARKTRIVVDKDGLIDLAEEHNAAFLQRFGTGNTTIPAMPEPAQLPPVMALPADEQQLERYVASMDDSAIPDYKLSEKKLKYLDTLKREKEIEKLELDNQKKKGEVVPTDRIEVLVFQYKQYMLTQQKISYQNFLNEIGHKYNITGDDMAEYRGYFVEAINKAMQEGTQEFLRNLGHVLREYSSKRNVGERE